MRILYTAVDTPIPGTDGGSVHVQELCLALARRHHDIQVAAPRGVDQRSLPAGLVVRRLRRPPRFLEWTAAGQIRHIAQDFEPDVIVDRFYTFGGGGIWAAHQAGIPAVLEVNSPARPYPGSWRDGLDRLSLLRPVDRWRCQVLDWSDAVYTTSVHLVPPRLQAAVTVVTNGVDIERFRPGPTRSNPPLCGVYASSFRAWHGAEDLVEAVRLCVARGVELEITCLGEGPRLAAARQAADRADLSGAIRFVGRVPFAEVPSYLAAADVGLAPFDPKAFSALKLGWFWSPIKIFEYLAAGLPVVTIDIEEMHRLLPSSVARFYPPGDAEALATTLEYWATHRTVLREAGAEARRLAVSRYTWDQQARAVEQVLREAVTRV